MIRRQESDGGTAFLTFADPLDGHRNSPATVLRFGGFELDYKRAELRRPDGKAIKLRPKTFDMLALFAANAGQLLSKQKLMETVWPNVRVGEDNLFQCIRELRSALGDDQRQLIKLVSGRGYLFDAEVSTEPAAPADKTPAPLPEPVEVEPEAAAAAAPPAEPRRLFGIRTGAALAALAGLGVVAVLAALMFRPEPGPTPLAIAVMPIASADPEAAQMAANVTTRLTDGLAKIDNIRVVTSQAASAFALASAPAAPADFVLSGELQKTATAWELRARMIASATREVVWTAPATVRLDDPDPEDADPGLQQSRLAAAIGHLVAVRINALVHAPSRTAATTASSPPGSAQVAIDQANASINQTSPERFAAAQAILERALAADPDNIDLAVALAALQLRGIQMVWYSPADSAAAEQRAKSMLERALRARPDSIPVLEAYCRFLTTANQYTESLVACARTLSFDPWNGLVLYHIGLTQIMVGRFEDALATFEQANRFDTPQVSRWTWRLGAGWACLMMGRDEEASRWLQQSIAITPASGRTHLLLAAAYQRLGRTEEARAAVVKALEMRPGSTTGNVAVPTKNASPVFLAASEPIMRAMIAAGLPER
jgi:DNA-binding winged helix-turn-helix (wHTH) protein/tetratricopeptide (TPR) repeat protein